MIPDSFIQDLLARVDIVDVVGQYVPLRKGGANLLGLCPFHNEKSPSFTVSPTKQFYHCFGCGAHGTAIRFLMEHTGASFPDAVRSLAGNAGMKVPEEERSPRQRAARAQREAVVSRHSEVLETANTHYRQQLRTARPAIEYLKSRGLSGEIAARFGLGWAGNDRQGLKAVLPNYDDPLLVESGLVILNEEGRRYDRFRERVTFPIRNARGHLIGFGGRIIGKGEPKYLNSPETPIFSKGSELYGMWEGRTAIRSNGMVIVVEGYMDVVALAQLGIECAVATLGTATTPVHVQKLLRASDLVIFSFDGDKAGRKAAWRALEACLPLLRDDASIRFLFLPEGHDPDSYVREFGPDGFRTALKEAMSLSQFMLSELVGRHPMEEAEGRARCIHDARPLLQAMPAGALRMQVQRELAQLTRLTPEELTQLIHLEDVPSGPLVHAASGQRGTVMPVVRSESNSGQAGGAHAQGGHGDGPQDDGHFPDYEPDMDGQYEPYYDDAAGGYDPSGGQGGQGQQGGYGQGGYGQGGGKYGGQGGGNGGGNGNWKGGSGKSWGKFDKNFRGQREVPGAPPPARRVVTPIAQRLLQLLLTHPASVNELDDASETMLASTAGFETVRELVALVRTTGASHTGALIQAAEGTSLAQPLVMAATATIYEDELPDPAGELFDALRTIEFDAAAREQQALIAGGLTGDDAKARYLALKERMAELKKPRVIE